MTRHYFTNSVSISSGDTHTIPGDEDLSIVIKGVFFSAYPQASVSGMSVFVISGLRGKCIANTALFAYTPSTAEVVNTSFPIHGKANNGDSVTLTLGAAEGDTASGQVTVWGYYTDEN